MNAQHYAAMVKDAAPKSKFAANCLRAFLIGGGICTAGQGILELFRLWGWDEDSAKTMTSVAMIFLGVLLTSLGVYDKLAKRAGAGTLVPITGFANAMSAPAIEFKTEGFITGTGAKLFVIAGPVLVYGTVGSVVYGTILWILHLFGITLF